MTKKKLPRWKIVALRVASQGTDALGVARVAYDYGATDAQARAFATRLCGYAPPINAALKSESV